jgi:hypothetical protein
MALPEVPSPELPQEIPMRPRTLDPEQLLREYNSGLSRAEIAAKHGKSKSHISKLLKSCPGYVSRNEKPFQPPKVDPALFWADYQAGMTQDEIARKRGVTQGTVWKHLQTQPGYKPNRKFRSGTGKPRWPQERIDRTIALYELGLPLAQVARQVGSNNWHVRQVLERAGVRIRSQSEAQQGQYNPCWKGGETMLGKYRYIYCPDHPRATKHGYVAEHRLVMEAHLGRFLTPEEVVHHKDRNPLNNAIENLQLFGCNADHLAFELKGQIPRWTAEGLARIAEGVRKPRKRRRKPNSPRSDAHSSSSPDGLISSLSR